VVSAAVVDTKNRWINGDIGGPSLPGGKMRYRQSFRGPSTALRADTSADKGIQRAETESTPSRSRLDDLRWSDICGKIMVRSAGGEAVLALVDVLRHLSRPEVYDEARQGRRSGRPIRSVGKGVTQHTPQEGEYIKLQPLYIQSVTGG
jgi:hypothetical protein